MKIDLNRGVEIRRHKATGSQVFMYVDEPGVYFNENAVDCGEEIARECGFDTETHGKLKERQERLEESRVKVEEDLGLDQDIEIAKRFGFTVIESTPNSHDIFDPNGQKVNAHPMEKAEAIRVMNQFADAAKKAEDSAKMASKVKAKESESKGDEGDGEDAEESAVA